MTRPVRLTVTLDEDVHPDRVLDALETDLGALEGVRVVDRWVEASADLGGAEIAVRATLTIDARWTAASIERSLADDLRRRRFGGSATVLLADEEPARAAVSERRSRAAVRDDVRRLVHLVPRGHVTTADAIGRWLELDVSVVDDALDELALGSAPAVPWHRVTNAEGRIGRLRSAAHDLAQTSRLESEGVPVRYERVVGFRARFVDPGRDSRGSIG